MLLILEIQILPGHTWKDFSKILVTVYLTTIFERRSALYLKGGLLHNLSFVWVLEISTEKRTGVGKIFKDTEAKKQPAYLVSFKTGLMLEWKMNLFSNTVSGIISKMNFVHLHCQDLVNLAVLLQKQLCAGVLWTNWFKHFGKFSEKHLHWRLYLKFHACILKLYYKRDSDKDIFPITFRNSQEQILALPKTSLTNTGQLKLKGNTSLMGSSLFWSHFWPFSSAIILIINQLWNFSVNDRVNFWKIIWH